MKRFGPVVHSIVAGVFFLILTVASCATLPRAPTAPGQAAAAITPRPLRAEARPGTFVLGPATKILVREGQKAVEPVADYLKGMLTPTGLGIGIGPSAVIAGRDAAPSGSILLRLDDLKDRLGDEGYLLDIGGNGVLVRAAAPAGLFYGVQTLRQLVSPAIERRAAARETRLWTIPCMSVEDRPRFAWRGAMLDCSRHFFPKGFIKRWIDILALNKLNLFHWHLTDDQGWRVEIKRYPRLTEVGAWRVDREDKPWNAREPQKPGEAATYGGFYTQDDIREIVAYAASRFVTIVPEIEMPGHAKAALTAYPELSCTGGPFTVPPGGYWPITDVFCPGNDGTFEFLGNVLAEVADLFPGPFIHVGGDEVDKTEWKRCPKCQARIKDEGLKDEQELQSYFVRRIEKILNAKGKRLAGWDEILEGGLAPQATVMSWRGTEGGIAAAQAGHDVVMSPTSHCYFDYYQGDPSYEPLGIGGFVPLNKVYSFDPVPEVLTGSEAAHVLGGQANLWTEYVSTGAHAEYMALPRLAALAEAVWSPKALRNWDDFAGRVGGLLARYDAAGLNAARSAYLVAIKSASEGGGTRAAVAFATEIPGLDIRYTTAGAEPGPTSKRYVKPVTLKRTTEFRAAAFSGRERLSPAISAEKFLVHAASGRRPALASPCSPRYPGSGAVTLTDGLLGSLNHGDGRWQGFEGTNLDAVIDLGRMRRVHRIAARFLQNINAWIFLPAAVEFSVSEDGRSFVKVAEVPNGISPRQAEILIRAFDGSFSPRRARYVRVLARTIGLVPGWHSGAGGKAWLFADEIFVE
jgi:hexosaminidase